MWNLFIVVIHLALVQLGLVLGLTTMASIRSLENKCLLNWDAYPNVYHSIYWHVYHKRNRN